MKTSRGSLGRTILRGVTFGLAGRDARLSTKQRSRRSLTLEPLEQRQMLSTSPLTIGSFSPSYTAVNPGCSVDLTVSNVTDSDGNVTSVSFYSGTYPYGSSVGYATYADSYGNWTAMVDTTGMSGTVGFYAVAQDDNYNTSDPATTNVTINTPPTIGSLSGSPNRLNPGTSLTLTASNVSTYAGGSIEFYRDSNGNGYFDSGDQGVGSTGCSNGSDSVTVDTTGLSGDQTFFAVALDGNALTSNTASTTVTFNSPPTVTSFSPSPNPTYRNGQFSLTASVYAESGAQISQVAFYQDSNGNGVLDSGDQSLGNGTCDTSGNWCLTLTAPNSSPPGGYTYFAIATDSNGLSSAAASTTLTNENAPPTIGSLSASPTDPIERGSGLALTANNVYDQDGYVTVVNFYTSSGTWLGSSTPSWNGGSASVTMIDTTGMSTGTQGFYAVATDNDYGTSSEASTTATIQHTPPTVTLSGNATAGNNTDYTLYLSATYSWNNPEGNSIEYWDISWGDGGGDTIEGTPSCASHRFTTPGLYTISATAVDQQGSYTATAQVLVAGTLDPVFGGGGEVETPSGTTEFLGVATLSNGRLVAVGKSETQCLVQPVIMRYTAEGTVPVSIAAPEGWTEADAVVARSADFVVAGRDADGCLEIGSHDTYVDGWNTGSSTLAWSDVDAIAAAPDGGIVVAGRVTVGGDLHPAVARWVLDNGVWVPDPNFNSGETLVLTSAAASASVPWGLAVDGSGRIVLSGEVPGASDAADFAVYRFNSNGSADTSFNNSNTNDAGMVTTDLGGADYATSVAIQSNGSIVAAGYTTDGSTSHLALVRYLSGGALDTTFGTGGVEIAPFSGAKADAIAIASNGKIVVAGSLGSDQFAVFRFNAGGLPDTSFGTGGAVDDAWGDRRAQAVSLQSDNMNDMIVVAGYADTGSGTSEGVLQRFLPNATDALRVRVDDMLPHVQIDGLPATDGQEGSEITLTANVQDAAQTSGFTYSWSVLKNESYDFLGNTNPNGAGVSFTPDGWANYDVSLTVYDGYGNSTTATAVITVDDVKPTLLGTAPTSTILVPLGATLHFQWNFSDPNFVDPPDNYTYTVGWGDGDMSVTNPATVSGAATVTQIGIAGFASTGKFASHHTFNTESPPGDPFNAWVEIEDGFGKFDKWNFRIEVVRVPIGDAPHMPAISDPDNYYWWGSGDSWGWYEYGEDWYGPWGGAMWGGLWGYGDGYGYGYGYYGGGYGSSSGWGSGGPGSGGSGGGAPGGPGGWNSGGPSGPTVYTPTIPTLTVPLVPTPNVPTGSPPNGYTAPAPNPPVGPTFDPPTGPTLPGMPGSPTPGYFIPTCPCCFDPSGGSGPDSGSGGPPDYGGDSNPHPIVGMDYQFPSGEPIPDDVQFTLDFDPGGADLGTTIDYSTAGFQPGNTVRMAQEIDAIGLASGHYTYMMAVTSYYSGGDREGDPVRTEWFSGDTEIVNRAQGPFGNRWWPQDIDQLVVDSGAVTLNGATLIGGNNTAAWFAYNAGTGLFTTPTGNSGTLAYNSGIFTLTYPQGNSEQFNAAGQMINRKDPLGNATQYTYNGDKSPSTVTDPLGRETHYVYTDGLCTSIVDFA